MATKKTTTEALDSFSKAELELLYDATCEIECLLELMRDQVVDQDGLDFPNRRQRTVVEASHV